MWLRGCKSHNPKACKRAASQKGGPFGHVPFCDAHELAAYRVRMHAVIPIGICHLPLPFSPSALTAVAVAAWAPPLARHERGT